jgi:outer membrane receptor protein involved in Fe transport
MKLTNTFIAAIIIFTNHAWAIESTDIEKITVSSDFRAHDIQNVTASVSVISADAIDQRHAFNLDEILALSANVNFASGASRGRFIQIRGIGERSQFAEPINPSVGLLVDDFDFSGVAGVATLFDVEQVEILRGPQATEFGAAGMAGTIKIKTQEADAQQSTKLTATIAQQDTWNLGIAHGDALSDNLFYRVAINQFKSNGFVYNQFLDTDDTDNLDELTARVKLKYLLSDKARLDLNYQYFDIDNGYDAFSLDNDGVTQSDEPGVDTQSTHALGLKGEFQLSVATLTTSLNYSQSEMVYGYDEDWTFEGFHPWAYKSTDYYFRDRDLISLDVRLLSNQDGLLFNDTTQWLAGIFVREIDESLKRQYTFAIDDFQSRYQPSNVAVYGQTDTQLSDNISVSIGFRVDQFEIDYRDSNGFTEQVNDTLLGGKAVLSYDIQTASIYTSVSRGYKAGGFNPDERVTSQRRLFEPEYNWNYEVGVKGQGFDDTLFMRVAVFYMDRENTQVSDFDVQLRDDGTPDFIDIIGNADVGTNKGLEIEADWQATDAMQVILNYGYLNATFSRYQLANGTQIEKQTQAQAPKHTFNLSILGYLNEKLSVRVEADAKDNYRFSDGHDVESPLSVVVNAQMRFDWQDWTFSVWTKNLFDREYYVRGFGGFSNDPRDEYLFAEPYFQLADGRQLGLTASLVY